MMNNPKDIAMHLYDLVVMGVLEEYSKKMEPEAIKSAVESRAIQMLEEICMILQNKDYDDPECFQKIDALVMLYWRELGIKIDRHSELE